MRDYEKKYFLPKTILDISLIIGILLAPIGIFSLERIHVYELLGLAGGPSIQPSFEAETAQEPSGSVAIGSTTEKKSEKNDVEIQAGSDTVVLEPDTEPFDSLRLQATAAYVYDVEKKAVLFEKSADTSLPLASITKVMTAAIAYEQAQDGTVTIAEEHVRAEGDAGLIVGEIWNVADLSDFMLVNSSNDGAEALTATAASRSAFIARMNTKARELKLSSMEFFNPTGLDESAVIAGGYGSAKDVGRLIAHLLATAHDTLVSSKHSTLTVQSDTQTHTAKNTNRAINAFPGLIASKTGFTTLAGGNLVIAFDAGINRPIVIVVLGSTFDGRFSDMKQLVQESIRYVAEE